MGGKKHKSKKKKRWEDEAFPVREEGFGFPDYGPALDRNDAPPQGPDAGSFSGNSPSGENKNAPSDAAEAGPDRKKAKKEQARSSDQAQESKAAEAEARSWQLAERYLNTLETQLQSKDQQLHALNERLQDAFDMQRALALLIKAYERRTGLLADAVWDEVPEDELGSEQRESKRSAAPPASGKAPAEDSHRPLSENREAPNATSTKAHNGGAFTQWLRQTGAKPTKASDA